MKNPPEKTLPYIAVAAIVGIVGSVLISLVSSAFMPSSMSGLHGTSGTSGDAAMTIKTADGEVKIDMKNMEELAKRMEALAAQNETKK